MNIEVTAKNDDTIRIAKDGAAATIRLISDTAVLLQFQLPEQPAADEAGQALLAAAEAAAADAGAVKLTYDYAENAWLSALFSANGYALSERGEMLSVGVKEVLGSDAVKHPHPTSVRGLKTESFDGLFSFQADDVIAVLNKAGYEIDEEDFQRCDPDLSVAAYDADHKLRGVLVASAWGEDLLLDFLWLNSRQNPRDLVSARVDFVRKVEERARQRGLRRIWFYACVDVSRALALRFLDRKYEPRKEHAVIRAEKALAVKNTPVYADRFEPDTLEDWKEETGRVLGERNISEKAVWLTHRKM